jgi:predicted O-linked N-acetylglucosamine transferase (SPINDLY family)
MPAVTVQQGFALALQHHQAGRLAEAEALYRQILAAQPDHAAAMHNLGVIARQRGDLGAAVHWIQQSVALDPTDADAQSNLGAIYCSLGRLDDAIACFERAAALAPNHMDKQNALGVVLFDRNRLDEAEAAFCRALALQPGCAAAHNNLGIVLARQGRREAALAAYQRALELDPGHAEAHNNLGSMLLNLGRFDEAAAAYRTALRCKPDYAIAYYNLANLLARRGKLGDAVAAYRRALDLQPDYLDAHNNLGVALADMGHLEEAAAAYQRALEIQPGMADAHTNLGNVFQNQGRLDVAVAAHRRALALNPLHPEAHSNLANALKDQGRLEESIVEYREALRLRPDSAPMHGNLIYALHFLPGSDRQPLTAEQARWNQRCADPALCLPPRPKIDRDPERRLRIGYVSPDFSTHVVGRNLRPLFQHHDHQNFEIVCYSDVVQPDRLTEDFRRHSDLWRDTIGMTDEALAGMIRQDCVDILVDLTQHMDGNRLPVFARQPAPLQVSFAGYPESTGVEAIEYRISDRWMEKPIDDRQSLETESEHIFLLDSFWCYDPCGMELAVKELPATTNEYVTFGSLNNLCKINDPLLRLWARVLAEFPDSRLVMLSNTGSHRQWITGILEALGIDPGRVEFLDRRPRQEYLEYYQRLDLVLDPFPYNGHTTSLDALWMGVPVVSLAGESAVSRAGLSQLSNLGLQELVAFSQDEYVQIATRLAGDLSRLRELRAALRSRMEFSVLMDAPRFARGIESAYRAMWRVWCRRTPAEK